MGLPCGHLLSEGTASLWKAKRANGPKGGSSSRRSWSIVLSLPALGDDAAFVCGRIPLLQPAQDSWRFNFVTRSKRTVRRSRASVDILLLQVFHVWLVPRPRENTEVEARRELKRVHRGPLTSGLCLMERQMSLQWSVVAKQCNGLCLPAYRSLPRGEQHPPGQCKRL